VRCTLPHSANVDRLITWILIGILAGCRGNDDNHDVQPPPPAPLPTDAIIYATVDGERSDLYIVDQDGTRRTAIAVSPDREVFDGVTSTRMIYTRFDENNVGDVFSVLFDGSATRPLAIAAEHEVVLAVLGDRVVYRRYASEGAADVFSVKADGTDPIALAKVGNDHFAAMAGNWLIFRFLASPQPEGIYSVALDGSGTRLLAPDAQDRFPHFAAASGERVFYEETLGDGVDLNLHAINADGTAPAALAATDDFEQLLRVAGDRVIYDRMEDSYHHLYAVGVDGSNPTALDTFPFVDVLFQGILGERVIYSRGGDLYSIRSDGSSPATLAASMYEEYFAGIAGDKVVFHRQSLLPSRIDIFAVAPDGTGPIALVETWANEYFEASTADRVIYRQWNDGQWDLGSVRPDGADEMLIAGGPDSDYFQAVSDDTVIFQRSTAEGGRDLYAVQADGTVLTVLAPSTGEQAQSFLAAITR
jgi:hypothetical protein